MKASDEEILHQDHRVGVVAPRLLIGVIILTCAEVFSGASLSMGLWHPWTCIVTFWLYFAHFFFFTTLAVRTGRTSFWSLYLWGVLFGLYESWITKVIWYGYDGNGKMALGRIGPYGFSEISMVFSFHPVMSFLLPLAVACVLCPPLRRVFPDLAWFTGKSRGALLFRAYLVFSLAPVVAMNCHGPVNLALNMALLAAVLLILLQLSGTALASSQPERIVVFGHRGFAGLCLYLAVLYGFFYFKLRPEGLPSAGVQLLTLVLYALAIAGLYLHQPRVRLDGDALVDQPRERRQILTVFGLVIGLGFLLSFAGPQPFLFVPFALNSILWTLAGMSMFVIALVQGIVSYRQVRSHSGGIGFAG